MRKKVHTVFLSITLSVLLINCVSPYYGTARIETGWAINAGAGLHSTVVPVLDAGPIYGLGLRSDVEIGYGFEKYFKPYVRGALGLNTASLYFGDIGVGFQGALPVGPITPAVKIEVNTTSARPTFAPAFLLGIGRKEVVTLGIRPQFVGFNPDEYEPFLDVLTTVHISPKLSIYIGAEVTSFIEYFDENDDIPFFSLGVGYKLPAFHTKQN